MYLERIADGVLDDLLANHPAVALVGPRGCGKTTTAARRVRSQLRLARPSDAAVARIDPLGVLADAERPAMIDEWQLVPEILVSVKDLVDEDPAPGQFVLTGSVNAEASTDAWPMTGRVIRSTLRGLVPRELFGNAHDPSFFERLLLGEPLAAPREGFSLRDYLELALRGGWPMAALASTDRTRAQFLRSYVEHMLQRDLKDVRGVRDVRAARRYLQAIAAATGTPVAHKTLYDAAGISRDVALGYDRAFDALMLTESVPAWTSNRLDRLVKIPKRHLTDPALVRPLLGVDARGVHRDPSLLGQVLESFVVALLRVEAEATEPPPQLSHVRDANGRREIDVIAEFPDGALVAVEVKATVAPSLHDARHLRWFTDRMGARVRAAIVFHAGPRAFRLPEDPRLQFLPISTLWAPS